MASGMIARRFGMFASSFGGAPTANSFSAVRMLASRLRGGGCGGSCNKYRSLQQQQTPLVADHLLHYQSGGSAAYYSSAAVNKDDGAVNSKLFRLTRLSPMQQEEDVAADNDVKLTNKGVTMTTAVAGGTATTVETAKTVKGDGGDAAALSKGGGGVSTSTTDEAEEGGVGLNSLHKLRETSQNPGQTNYAEQRCDMKFHSCLGEFDVTWDDLMERKFQGC
eukprot:GHVS01041883.1.p1 GENE.GHVS01041883.1~~GHVS01041883.1.p1  ORF type:complete len:221 (-),score=58.69 GHVS01041883.1:461-1123(-)